MVSARETLSSIEQAIIGTRRDEDRLTAMLRTATDEAARLRAKQADAYKALARLKLDALARDEVVGPPRFGRAAGAGCAGTSARRRWRRSAEERAKLVAAAATAEKQRSERGAALERAIDAVEALTESDQRASQEDQGVEGINRGAVGAAEAKAARRVREGQPSGGRSRHQGQGATSETRCSCTCGSAATARRGIAPARSLATLTPKSHGSSTTIRQGPTITCSTRYRCGCGSMPRGWETLPRRRGPH